MTQKSPNPVFDSHVLALPAALSSLLNMAASKVGKCNIGEGVPGVYLLSEHGSHLYVGRANDIAKRMKNHVGSWRQAPFAFRLAREATGNLTPSYRPKGSREDLMRDATFCAAFNQAKTRIRSMEVRWVKEDNPIRQCLIEVYVATAVQAPYNDFGNH